ncbi:MAG TPA: hypothetical protein VF622_11255, partial [Segetibacter sp.]
MKTILVKLLLLIAVVCFYLNGFAQNSRNQVVLTSTPLNWTLSTAVQLENEQQISNAFNIRAYSNNNTGYS